MYRVGHDPKQYISQEINKPNHGSHGSAHRWEKVPLTRVFLPQVGDTDVIWSAAPGAQAQAHALAHAHIQARAHARTHVRACVRACVHACMHARTHARTHAHAHVHVPLYRKGKQFIINTMATYVYYI